MITQFKRIAVLMAMVFATSVALSACNTDNLSGQQVVSEVQAAVANLHTFHGTVSISASSPMLKDGASLNAEVWASKPNMGRIEIKSISVPKLDNVDKPQVDLTGATLVSDGSKAWLYVPSDNHVYVGSVDGEHMANLPTEVLTQLQSRIDAVLKQSDIKVIGDEQVAGRNTSKIEITVKQDAASIGNGSGTKEGDMKSGAAAMLLRNSKLTLWIDKEMNLPVQVEIDAPMAGKVTITSSGDEFNQPIASDKFTFTPPAGATVTDVGALADRHHFELGGQNK